MLPTSVSWLRAVALIYQRNKLGNNTARSERNLIPVLKLDESLVNRSDDIIEPDTR